MGSTFSGLSIAISGLFTNKKSLDVTSHNIANVNNPNYIRQQAIQASSKYTQMPDSSFKLGTGVNLQIIRQIRDEFLDLKYRLQSQELGYWSAKNSVLEQVQEIMNEMSDSGLQKVMDQFWNAWDELSKKPDNLTIRGLLKERAIAFVETVNHMHKQLDQLQINLNKDIKDAVTEVNNIAMQIADLNDKIMQNEIKGIKANDYRDSRNQLLDRLAQLVNIQYTEDNTGVVNVNVGGKAMVSSRFYNEMEVRYNGSSYVDIHWKDTGEKVDISTGELKGLIESRGDVENTIIGKENGMVNEEVDVIFAYDSANLDMSSAVASFQTDFNNRGFDTDYYDEIFTTDIDTLISNIEGLSLRENSHKKLILFTNESIGGDGVTKSNDSISDYVSRLNKLGISVTVVSDPNYRYTGDIGEDGWDAIINGTGGSFFDINDITLTDFAEDLAQETTNTASRHMGNITDYREIIPTIKQRLNTFVNTIARNINYLHRQGYTLGGIQGIDFFVASNSSKPIQADNIKLNDNLNTLNNIAASYTGDTGDGKIAEQIVNLREVYLFGEMNSDDYYRDIISDIGVVGNETLTMKDSQEVIIQQIDDKRKSISGVSLDEEMTEMLKYQHSYVANTRVVNAIDEMIDNIINRMGVVGR